MEMNQGEWELEQQHLDKTLGIAREQWETLAGRSTERAAAIEAAREEMLERVTYDMGGLNSAQGFADLMELSQAAQPLTEAAAAQGFDDAAMESLLRTLDTPYFARIDFAFEGQPRKQLIYIGRSTLMEKGGYKILVYDWRTPIASVFYRYGVGPAQYQAPSGLIKGEVSLKRQYEIRRGKLIYYFDADVQVMDGFLRELLSRSASMEMKAIVETIQRDQDMVIRDMESDVLMVQGSAGSGKTSVALHRVAYLMYQGLAKARLSSQDILILSPNAVFERYISRVLPELGEQQVQTALFDELFQQTLPGLTLQRRSDWVEEWLSCKQDKERLRRVRAFKGDRAFVTLMDRLVEELPRRWIPFRDMDYAGQCVYRGDLMRVKICNTKKRSPLGIRLKWLEKEIWEQVHSLREKRTDELMEFTKRFPHHALEMKAYARMLSIGEHARLLKLLRSFTRINSRAIYRGLFSDAAAVQRLGRGLAAPELLEEVRVATLQGLGGDIWPYQDAAALTYLEERIYGHGKYAHFRQVVVDEAQDVDEMHMALLRLFFHKARFTILGDVHQTVVGRVQEDYYEKVKLALNAPSAVLARLNKSFRCTKEIWDFSVGLLPEGSAGECFSRSGDRPQMHGLPTPEALDKEILQTALEAKAQGHGAVALICKTEQEAQALYQRLAAHTDLGWISSEKALDISGVFVIPLNIAKGLEFDAVLVCDGDAVHYHGEDDRNLLYVACTRALHRLDVLYMGQPSPWLPKQKEEKA